MYSATDFTQLPKNEQIYSLFHGGKELLIRHTNHYTIKLFILNNFFAEVWYQSPRSIIEKIQVVSEEDLVRYYDKEINLSNLI